MLNVCPGLVAACCLPRCEFALQECLIIVSAVRQGHVCTRLFVPVSLPWKTEVLQHSVSHSLRAGAVPGAVGPGEGAGALGQGLGPAGAGSRAAPGAVPGGLCRQPVQPHPGISFEVVTLSDVYAMCLPMILHALPGMRSVGTAWSISSLMSVNGQVARAVDLLVC